MELSIRSWRRPEPRDLPFVNIFVWSAVAHGVLMMMLLFEPTDVAALPADLFDQSAGWHRVGCLCIIVDPPVTRVDVRETIAKVTPYSQPIREHAEQVLTDSHDAIRQCLETEMLPRHGAVELTWVVKREQREVTVRRSNLPASATQCIADTLELRPWWSHHRHVIELDIRVMTHWDPLPSP